jgi:pentatricopeptide repeat protein
LIEEMRSLHELDVITYNTLLKGYCQRGDLAGAKRVFQEMIQCGHKPNDISFNCLLNTAVCAGSSSEMWTIIEQMEENGLEVDNFTVSIMMKSIRRCTDSKDVSRVLSLMDDRMVDICCDEVLLNTVLETCTRHGDIERLEKVFNQMKLLNVKPSVHTYASVIKACSALKRVDRCWQLWTEMVDERGLQPNDLVLGCMLDALVRNDDVDVAISLMRKWSGTVPPNTIIYSTLIKGLANRKHSKRAMELWEEMCESKTPINTVVYNTLIDAQSRVGAMGEVARLIERMEIDGCEADVITYSTIVKGHCVKGDLDSAFSVFRSMKQKHMAINSIIYNTVLDGCTRQGRTDLVDELLLDMDTHNIAASNFTLSILVKMYGRSKRLARAFEVFEVLPKKHGFVVNTQVKTCLMCACLNNDEAEKAFQIFDDIKASAGGADAKAYGALISGTVRCGRLTDAVRFVEEGYGLTVDTRRQQHRTVELEPQHLDSLLRALYQDGQSDTIVMLLEKFRKAGVSVTSRFVSSMKSRLEGLDASRADWQRRRGETGRACRRHVGEGVQ